MELRTTYGNPEPHLLLLDSSDLKFTVLVKFNGCNKLITGYFSVSVLFTVHQKLAVHGLADHHSISTVARGQNLTLCLKHTSKYLTNVKQRRIEKRGIKTKAKEIGRRTIMIKKTGTKTTIDTARHLRQKTSLVS